MSRSALIHASADRVWQTLADFAAIGTWAPNVVHSSPASDPGVGIGAVRRVQVGRQALLERVTQWVPGERLGYRIDGLPPVVGEVETTWQLVEQSDGTQVTVTTTVAPSPRPPGPIVGRVVARRMAAAASEMLTGLAAQTERHEERV